MFWVLEDTHTLGNAQKTAWSAGSVMVMSFLIHFVKDHPFFSVDPISRLPFKTFLPTVPLTSSFFPGRKVRREEKWQDND